ncbi:MAG: hypothetical protein WD600_02745, partial [Pseudohongiella sp.]
MNTATIIISAMAISQFVFLAVHFLIHYRQSMGKLVAAFSVCTIAYLLNESMGLEDGSLTDIVLDVMATLAPFLLWLIASKLFIDEREKQTLAWLAIALCYTLDIVSAAGFVGNAMNGSNTTVSFTVYFVPQLILLGFPLHAIYMAIRGYDSDLLEERRTFRLAFITGLGVVVIFIVTCDILNDVLQGGLAGGGAPYVILASLCLFLVALIFNLGLVQSSSGALNRVLAYETTELAAEPGNHTTDTLDVNLVQAIERAVQ